MIVFPTFLAFFLQSGGIPGRHLCYRTIAELSPMGHADVNALLCTLGVGGGDKLLHRNKLTRLHFLFSSFYE